MKPKHTFKAPAFQLYAKEFLQDEAVIVMEPAAVGVYIILLCHQWNEGSVPADLSLLARICRTTTELMGSVWPQVECKFRPSRSGKSRLVNPKLEMVRSEKIRFTQKQSASGARGAQEKWKDKANENKAIDGVAQSEPMATPLGSGWASDGSGSGSVILPLTPSGEGAGVVTSNAEPPKKAPRLSVSESVIDEYSGCLHGRHSPVRRGTLAEVKSQLRAILRKVPAAEQLETLRRIDSNHASWCATEDWRKDGGVFAKGLVNWLAPTKGRWEMPADTQSGSPTHSAGRSVEPDYLDFTHDPAGRTAVAS